MFDDVADDSSQRSRRNGVVTVRGVHLSGLVTREHLKFTTARTCSVMLMHGAPALPISPVVAQR